MSEGTGRTQGVNPIARVVIDSPLPHLDRPFDYAVPEDMAGDAVAGARVQVRFAGKKTAGFILELTDSTDHEGTLAPLLKVVSSEPVLTPEVAQLARAVADRWAGTMADVLRLAIPPRHAATEAKPPREVSGLPDDPVGSDAWLAYLHGPEFVAELEAGGSPRIVFGALPHHDPAASIAEVVAATLASGRGSIVCVPDARDLARWSAVFTEVLGKDRFVVLTAADSAAKRYRAFLDAARGGVQVVLGTRAAAYAPVRNLGLVAIWDDGDDSHVEPRAPYAHAREVLLLRATLESAGVIVGGYARTPEATSLVSQGWAREIGGDQVARRREWPRVELTDGSDLGAAPVRLPKAVFATMRDAEGPILIQVPRRGYRPSLACQQCRTPADCRECHGPLSQARANAPIVCRWCGLDASPWSCAECGGTQFRAPVVGTLRTAEEFAAAFPDHQIVTSSGSAIVDNLADHVEGGVEGGVDKVIVLATPGAEPVAPRGYAAIILLDTWLLLGRDDVRVVEEAHRRWFNALALGGHSAKAVAVGDPQALQALVRADPVSVGVRELEHRADTHWPPIGRLAVAEGSPDDVAQLAIRFKLARVVDILGPVPFEENTERLVLRTPRAHGARLAAELKEFAAERSAKKLPVVRTQIDPHHF